MLICFDNTVPIILHFHSDRRPRYKHNLCNCWWERDISIRQPTRPSLAKIYSYLRQHICLNIVNISTLCDLYKSFPIELYVSFKFQLDRKNVHLGILPSCRLFNGIIMPSYSLASWQGCRVSTCSLMLFGDMQMELQKCAYLCIDFVDILGYYMCIFVFITSLIKWGWIL